MGQIQKLNHTFKEYFRKLTLAQLLDLSTRYTCKYWIWFSQKSSTQQLTRFIWFRLINFYGGTWNIVCFKDILRYKKLKKKSSKRIEQSSLQRNMKVFHLQAREQKKNSSKHLINYICYYGTKMFEWSVHVSRLNKVTVMYANWTIFKSL